PDSFTGAVGAFAVAALVDAVSEGDVVAVNTAELSNDGAGTGDIGTGDVSAVGNDSDTTVDQVFSG
ncbi:MAG: hypothetical protein ACRD0G_01305, partial [Acidimicrobiales bacterium]